MLWLLGKYQTRHHDKYPTSTQQVTPQVIAVLQAAVMPVQRALLQEVAGLGDREHFANSVLKPLLTDGLLEMTIPAKPRSSKQRYHLTEKGRALLVEKIIEETKP